QDKLISERVILATAMSAAVIATAAVSLQGVQNDALAQGFEALALLWLVGASVFLYRSIGALQMAASTRAAYDMRGDLVYIDSAAEKPKLFVSKVHGLSGRPDAVVMDGEHHIPVELKTGRVPRGPLFSHILQVVAYCVLLEEEYGRAPPYGIIRYGETAFEIEYNEDQKSLLLQKLGRCGPRSRGAGPTATTTGQGNASTAPAGPPVRSDWPRAACSGSRARGRDASRSRRGGRSAPAPPGASGASPARTA